MLRHIVLRCVGGQILRSIPRLSDRGSARRRLGSDDLIYIDGVR